MALSSKKTWEIFPKVPRFSRQLHFYLHTARQSYPCFQNLQPYAGMFVGAVSDNFNERIEQKIFHAEIVMDVAKVSAEMKAYQPIPTIAEFTNKDGSDNLKETIEANYKRVKQDILSLVASEMERIKNDPNLKGLIKESSY